MGQISAIVVYAINHAIILDRTFREGGSARKQMYFYFMKGKSEQS